MCSIKTESAFKSEAGLLGIAIQNHPLLFLLLRRHRYRIYFSFSAPFTASAMWRGASESCNRCWASLCHRAYCILIAFCTFSSSNLTHLNPSVPQLRQWQWSKANTNITAGVAHQCTHPFCIRGVCLLAYATAVFFLLSVLVLQWSQNNELQG